PCHFHDRKKGTSFFRNSRLELDKLHCNRPSRVANCLEHSFTAREDQPPRRPPPVGLQRKVSAARAAHIGLKPTPLALQTQTSPAIKECRNLPPAHDTLKMCCNAEIVPSCEPPPTPGN